MVQRMQDAGIPAAVSYTAGTYVCNSLMYTLLFLIDRKFPSVRGGFIHVPYAMEQAVNKPLGTPSMDLRQISRGLEKAVEAVVICSRDTAVPMGIIMLTGYLLANIVFRKLTAPAHVGEKRRR